MRTISPIDASLVEYQADYLLAASGPHTVITGAPKTGYYAVVRGWIDDDGREVEVGLKACFKAIAEMNKADGLNLSDDELLAALTE